jgi:hypothetical protein
VFGGHLASYSVGAGRASPATRAAWTLASRVEIRSGVMSLPPVCMPSWHVHGQLIVIYNVPVFHSIHRFI